MIKKTNILTHTYSKSDLPMNQNVETSAWLHSSCFRLQFQLYWKISFPLEFSNIAYNVKCNRIHENSNLSFFKVKVFKLLHQKMSDFTRLFFLEKNHSFTEIWVFHAVLLLAYLTELMTKGEWSAHPPKKYHKPDMVIDYIISSVTWLMYIVQIRDWFVMTPKNVEI